MAAVAARSVLRSSARLGCSKFAKPTNSPSSPFLLPKLKPPSSFISRIPVEMSCAMDTMLPFHSATASALLTSMLSVSPRIYNWTLQVLGVHRSWPVADDPRRKEFPYIYHVAIFVFVSCSLPLLLELYILAII